MKTLKKYLITLAIGLLTTFLIVWYRGIFSETEAVKIFHTLCDAFFIAGTLLTCGGLLVFSSNEGTFDMIVYGLQSFWGMFRKNAKLKHESFYDYRESRSGKKIKFGYIVFTGLFFLAMSGVMYLLYLKYA